ncbi:hypothetical protein ER308_15165 [Egibacter rhizosphaerae]|uniref:Uncharacterized protein n=1 Tax=Egibacter rhizosphaerae TaxID=1670831 RepID=A0A411YI25_9ACTN|nr:hypothetical protein [Egibacter rhizosphaerae]QBI20771.1 hypothetical protein ER308_15165 [Egibacter rhizosphaerae]
MASVLRRRFRERVGRTGGGPGLTADEVETHVYVPDGRREPSPPAPFEFVADLVRVELLD